jgi:hypothetical protein
MVVAAPFTRAPVWLLRRGFGEARRIAAELNAERFFNRTERFAVIDLIYILTTLAFFGLMIAYVRACEHLGRAPSDADKSAGETP